MGIEFVVAIIILIFSAILHEIMHGVAANKLGDPTARLMGRLTLNPLPHIDPIMSVILPISLYFLSGGQVIFAAAKPVPVNPIHFKDPRRDMALVALAGPLTNFAIAIIAALLIHPLLLMGGESQSYLVGFTYFVLLSIVRINLFLGFLNLLPIPPLDGSKVFSIVLPSDMAATYLSIERYGIFILFFLLSFPIAGFSIGDFLGHLVNTSMDLLIRM